MCVRTLSSTKARYTVSLQESTVHGENKKAPNILHAVYSQRCEHVKYLM